MAKGSARIGRPPKPIDLATVERAAGIGCNEREIAAICDVHFTTFYDKHKNEGDDGPIAQAIARGRAKGTGTIRRLQWQKANSGDTAMLIWLGKVMLGQKDTSRQELTGADGGAIHMRYSWAKPEPPPVPGLDPGITEPDTPEEQ